MASNGRTLNPALWLQQELPYRIDKWFQTDQTSEEKRIRGESEGELDENRRKKLNDIKSAVS